MKPAFILFIALCILTAFLLILLFYHLHTLKLMRRLDNMIASAIDGTFTEQVFDESRISALENRFAKYLSASETSYKNVAAEKNTIKELISDISHQTKTPGANILLYAELLQEQDLSEETAQYVSSLTAQAEKLNFLITSLVKLSRLETGILSLSAKRTPVFPMIQNLMEQFAPPGQRKRTHPLLRERRRDRRGPCCRF